MKRRHAWLLMAAAPLAVAAPAQAGDGSFGAGQDFPIGAPASVAIGDFNSDGRHDVAAVSYRGGYVRVRLGTADQGFEPAPDVPVGKDPLMAVVADFTGDGHDDLAVINVADKDVSVRVGNGDGTFKSQSPPDVALARFPVALAVGDFNADGGEDLAITTGDNLGESLAVRLGTGNGTFVSVTDLNVAARPLAVGDFDADGNEDLAAGRLTQSAAVLRGSGGGAFVAGVPIALPGAADARRALAVGDFDTDSKQDVVAAVYDKDVVSVQLGDGSGGFGGLANVPVGDNPVAVAVGDFNSDGNEDLAVANAAGSTVSVRLGNGFGGFRTVRAAGAGSGPVDVAVADFDGDGNEDLAVANFAGDSVSVRYGLGTPPLAGNLLVNGGFEGAGAAGRTLESPAIPGWQRTGAITFAGYGLTSHAFFPSRLAAPRYLTGGLNLLLGGDSAPTGGVTAAFQTVDVARAAASIDAGLARVTLSAYLGGARHFDDRMTARAGFLSAAGATLGSLEIGPVTAADRNGLTTMLPREANLPLPVGTRRIRVTLTSTDDDKSYSSAVADNVRLTLTAPDPLPVPTGPGPGPGGGTGGEPPADRMAPVISSVTLAPRAFAVGRRARTSIRYTLSEAATVTLRFQRAASGRRAGGSCLPVRGGNRGGRRCRRWVPVGTLRGSGSSGPNRVAFGGRIRRRALAPGAHRLIVGAVDPAGNASRSEPQRFRIVR